MGKAKKDENLCAQSEFIKLLAQELGVTQAVSKHIYMVFYIQQETKVINRKTIYDLFQIIRRY